MITSLSELYFRIRRFILLEQTKKVVSMNYGSSTSSWKSWRWARLDVRDIYINSNLNPFTKVTSSSRSTKFRGILPWNISQMIMKTIPISTRIVMSYGMKLRQQPDQSFPVEGKPPYAEPYVHCIVNTSIRRKK